MFSNKFKIFFWIVMVVIIGIGIYIISDVCYAMYHYNKYPYMAGKTGIKCYLRDNGRGNIKHHMFFIDLGSCEEYVKNNK